LLFPRKNNF